MANAKRIQAIRKQLTQDGADPFVVAAAALEKAERYERLATDLLRYWELDVSTQTQNLRNSARSLPQTNVIPFPQTRCRKRV